MGYSNKTEGEQRQRGKKRQERQKGIPGVKGGPHGPKKESWPDLKLLENGSFRDPCDIPGLQCVTSASLPYCTDIDECSDARPAYNKAAHCGDHAVRYN